MVTGNALSRAYIYTHTHTHMHTRVHTSGKCNRMETRLFHGYQAVMHGAGIRRFGPQETQEFSRAKRNVTIAFSPTPRGLQ